MDGKIIAIIVIAALIVLALLYIASTYNSLIRKRNSVEEAFATMDVYLKKRWDLIRILLLPLKAMQSMKLKHLKRL